MVPQQTSGRPEAERRPARIENRGDPSTSKGGVTAGRPSSYRRSGQPRRCHGFGRRGRRRTRRSRWCPVDFYQLRYRSSATPAA